VKRRQRIKPLKQWLDEVRPLMNAPDAPPRPSSFMQAVQRMPRSRRLLVDEYSATNVMRALNATSSEDPATLEEWLKKDRAASMEKMMQRRMF
jgi:hypothetical protein